MDKIRSILASQPQWPDAKDVVGTFRGMKGKYSCWEVKDLDGEPFRTILEKVQTELKHCCGRVPKSYLLGYDIFMIGETPETSIPHIMFHCCKEAPRKEAVNHIKRSGLLKEYKGLGVGQWRSPPYIPNISLAGGKDRRESNSQHSNSFHLGGILDERGGGFSDTKPLVLLVKSRGVEQPTRKATVAEFIKFAGEVCCIAPAHVFVESENGEESSDLSDNEEFEFSGFQYQSLDIEEEEENSEIGSLSNGSESSQEVVEFATADNWFEAREPFPLLETTSEISDSDSTPSFEDHFWSPKASLVNLRRPNYFQDSILASTALDYVLLPMSSKEVVFFNCVELCDSTVGFISEKQSWVFTENTSGHIIWGVLSNRPSHMCFPESHTYQKVYPVSLQGKLEPGDCGAIFRCCDTGAILGHIVAGSFESSIAYVVPASDVLANILQEDACRVPRSTVGSTDISHSQMSVAMDLMWNSHENAGNQITKGTKTKIDNNIVVSSADLEDGAHCPELAPIEPAFELEGLVTERLLAAPGYGSDDEVRSQISVGSSSKSMDSGYYSANSSSNDYLTSHLISLTRSTDHYPFSYNKIVGDHISKRLVAVGGEPIFYQHRYSKNNATHPADDYQEAISDYWWSAQTVEGEGGKLKSGDDSNEKGEAPEQFPFEMLESLPLSRASFTLQRFVKSNHPQSIMDSSRDHIDTELQKRTRRRPIKDTTLAFESLIEED
jgi:hypothetical protein